MAESQAANGTIDDGDILSVIVDHADPCVTAVEITEQFGFSQQAAHWRLSKLADEGKVARKKTGARAVGWWIPGDYFIASET